MSSGDSTEARKAQDLSIEGKALKRDHDSMDDFEHLEHDSSPVQDTSDQPASEQRQQQSAPFNQQLPDVPRVDNLIDISKSFETNFMKSGEFADGSDLRPVPATPPPSADFEKCEAMAHLSDPLQRPLTAQALQGAMGDPKGATMAFMETERSYAPVHQATPHEQIECEVTSTAADSSVTKHEQVKAADVTSVESAATAADPLACGVKTNANTNASTNASTNAKMSGEEPAFGTSDNSQDALGKGSQESAVRSHEEKDLLGATDLISTKEVKQNEPDMSVFSSTAGSVPGLDGHTESKEIRDDFLGEIRSSVLPAPEKSPTIDFLGEDVSMKDDKSKNIMDDDSWNVVEKPDSMHEKVDELIPEPPMKPLPPLPKEADLESDKSSNPDKFEMSNDFIAAEGANVKTQQQQHQSDAETGDSEFESEPEPSPAKTTRPVRQQEPSEPEDKPYCRRPPGKVDEIEIAPKEIFRDMDLDAWFNPERLNPKVAALIYWRDPKKSGIVFGTILGVLLSLAYFSLISVLAYCSLTVLLGTVAFRMYKCILQAVQKTADGHPFKDVLDLDLTLPAEKVHEFADVAVAHANAMVAELRRVFLVEDFVDSFKFGVLLWCLTYVGSWFNGMTLVIMGVVALFTLPKLYETNKVQIDQNVALAQGKVNELTAKLKAVIPLGKKAEPTKEE